MRYVNSSAALQVAACCKNKDSAAVRGFSIGYEYALEIKGRGIGECGKFGAELAIWQSGKDRPMLKH